MVVPAVAVRFCLCCRSLLLLLLQQLLMLMLPLPPPLLGAFSLMPSIYRARLLLRRGGCNGGSYGDGLWYIMIGCPYAGGILLGLLGIVRDDGCGRRRQQQSIVPLFAQRMVSPTLLLLCRSHYPYSVPAFYRSQRV